MIDALARVGTILVLGGTSDIGLATCQLLLDRGTQKVILAGRDGDRLEAAKGSLRARDASVETSILDVTRLDDHEEWTKAVWHDAGDIDLVLVCAGVLGGPDVAHSAPEALGVLNTNMVGLVSLLLHITPLLREQGHGRIVVMSSVAAERPRRANYVYGSSKAGLDAFAQGLSDDLVGSGVGVTVVRPGFVRTKMTAHLPPAPFSSDPSSVAEAVLAGIARGSHTIWVPARLRWVFAVIRHLPRSIFRRIRS